MRSILIVDDNASMRSYLRRALESQFGSAVCREANDGVEAIEMIKDAKPDLIVLDLSMRGMNGIETAKAVAAMAGPPPAMIMFTLHKHIVPLDVAHSAGITAVVSKSDGIEPLLEEILRLPEANSNGEIRGSAVS